MLAGLNNGEGKKIVAWNSALLYDMIYTQPVFYEFEHLKSPVLLMIGDKDTTAIGKNLAPLEIQKNLGNYPVLAQEALKRFPNATLISFPDYGHSPQMQAPQDFNSKLIEWLK